MTSATPAVAVKRGGAPIKKTLVVASKTSQGDQNVGRIRKRHHLHHQAKLDGAGVVVRRGGGVSALMYAAQQGDTDAVRKIIQEKPSSLRSVDRTKKTALHYTTTSDNIRAAQAADLLVMAAPDLVEGHDEDGFTPLHLAVIAGNMPLVTFLLANKADVNAVDNEKHTVVHWATVCGETSSLRAVLAAGAPVSTPDVHGGYPLHYAAQMCSNEKDPDMGLQVLHALLTHTDIVVSVQDGDGRQPLLWAASAGSTKALLALIKAGSHVESSDRDGLTALHCAASRGHTDCIDTLLTLCGASPDVIDTNGCTALHYSVTLGHADATALLLVHGADPNRQDRKGRSPAHCGCAKGQFETVKMIGAHGANLWLRNARGDLPLHEAAASGRRDLVRWLLEMRPSQVNARNNDGRCPLHLAALNDNSDMCKILLDAGAQINPILRTSKNRFMTPLDCALQRGFRSTAKFLQLHGGIPASRLGDLSSQTGKIAIPSSATLTQMHIRDDVTLLGDVSSDESEVQKIRPKSRKSLKQQKSSSGTKTGGRSRLDYSNEIVINGKTEINIHQTKNITISGQDRGEKTIVDETLRPGTKKQSASRAKSRQDSGLRPPSTKPEPRQEPLYEDLKTMGRQSSRSNSSEEVAGQKVLVESVLIHEPPPAKAEDKISSRTEVTNKGEMKSNEGLTQKEIETQEEKTNQEIGQAGFEAQEERSKIDQKVDESAGPKEVDPEESLSRDQKKSEKVSESTGPKEVSPEEPSKIDPKSGEKVDDSTGPKEEPSTKGSEKGQKVDESPGPEESSIPDPKKSDKVAETPDLKQIGLEEVSKEDQRSAEKVEESTGPKEANQDEPSMDSKTSKKVDESSGPKEVDPEGSSKIDPMKSQVEETSTIDSKTNQKIIESIDPNEVSQEQASGEKVDESTGPKELDPEEPSAIDPDASENVAESPGPQEVNAEEPKIDPKKSKKVTDSPGPSEEPSPNETIVAQQTQKAPVSKGPPDKTEEPKSPKSDEASPKEDQAKPQKKKLRKKRSTSSQKSKKPAYEIIYKTIGANEEFDDATVAATSPQDQDESTPSELAQQQEESTTPSDSSTIKEHKSFKILAEEDEAQTSKKRRASSKKRRSRSEEPGTSHNVPKSKIPTPLRRRYSKSDRHLDQTSSKAIESRVPSLPNISRGVKEDDDLGLKRQSSNLSAPHLQALYSDEKTDEEEDEERSSSLRRRKVKRKKKSNNYTAGSDYESSNVMDSGFEPSPRSSRIPRWKNMSEKGVNMTSVTQSIQNNIRRYHLERKIFQQLLDLKRMQIRAGQHNESVLVKRAIDQYHQSCASTVGAGRYIPDDFTFKSFEKFLYLALRKLQKTSGLDHLQGLPESPNPLLCTRSTHRCNHAAHAYTGIPCAAYLPKMDHHTIPKIGFSPPSTQCKPGTGFLPTINNNKHKAVTLELCHGGEKQTISLPADKLDQNKRYYVTFTVKGSESSAPSEGQGGHTHSRSD